MTNPEIRVETLLEDIDEVILLNIPNDEKYQIIREGVRTVLVKLINEGESS